MDFSLRMVMESLIYPTQSKQTNVPEVRADDIRLRVRTYVGL